MKWCVWVVGALELGTGVIEKQVFHSRILFCRPGTWFLVRLCLPLPRAHCTPQLRPPEVPPGCGLWAEPSLTPSQVSRAWLHHLVTLGCEAGHTSHRGPHRRLCEPDSPQRSLASAAPGAPPLQRSHETEIRLLPGGVPLASRPDATSLCQSLMLGAYQPTLSLRFHQDESLLTPQPEVTWRTLLGSNRAVFAFLPCPPPAWTRLRGPRLQVSPHGVKNKLHLFEQPF